MRSWRHSGADGEYGVQPPLTNETVREAEHVLGVTLPSALLDLLRVQDGGVVAADHDAFPTSQPTSWSQGHVPFDALMGIGRLEQMTSISSPVASSGKPGLTCIDTRHPATPDSMQICPTTPHFRNVCDQNATSTVRTTAPVGG
jgi:cell wall assembly regulator SMI1